MSSDERADLAYRMAVYAAVLHETDEHIGRLVDHLKETGEYDNTLIVLASDNGASPSTLDFYATLAEEGWHEETYSRLGDVRAYGAQGSFPALGFINAQISSGPFVQAKNTLMEGGTPVPALIKEPSIDGSYESRVVDTLAHITDLYPTFMDYAGLAPESADNLIGDSAKPLLEGTSESIGDDEYGWEHFGNRAYRSGKWKLVFTPPQSVGRYWTIRLVRPIHRSGGD